MTKRTDAQQAREAISRLSFGDARNQHVRDGLLLAAIVHHYLPLDLWTRQELEAALRLAGFEKLAEELAPPKQLEFVEEYVDETPEPKIGWIQWVRTAFR